MCVCGREGEKERDRDRAEGEGGGTDLTTVGFTYLVLVFALFKVSLPTKKCIFVLFCFQVVTTHFCVGFSPPGELFI